MYVCVFTYIKVFNSLYLINMYTDTISFNYSINI